MKKIKAKVNSGVERNRFYIVKERGSFFDLLKNNVAAKKSNLFYSGVCLTDECVSGKTSIVLDKESLINMKDGDIFFVDEYDCISVVWKKDSLENVLYLTDNCNEKCIMCPQLDFKSCTNHYDDAKEIISLVTKTPEYLCITGGEPTFFKDRYLSVISLINNKFKNVNLQILTNGQNFSDFEFSKQCVRYSPFSTLYCIPLYASNGVDHNKIVNSSNGFENTIKGIYNLYRFKQDIEIRIVITKKNYLDLQNIAHFIYWNLPFVSHVAFMGMEIHGNAEKNFDEIWVDPIEFKENLRDAVLYLSGRKVTTSIYNIPYCLLESEVYSFAKDSISGWKKMFLQVCDECSMKDKCSGLFATSCYHSENIRRI